MYDLTVPPLVRGLHIMDHYLDVIEDHVNTYKVDEHSILSARLAPDMMTFTGQLQRVSDNAKNGAARLAVATPPRLPDSEMSVAELRVRLSNTVDFLMSLKPEQFEGSEARVIDLKFASLSGKYEGQVYLLKFLLPNYYFHISTAHGILRNLRLNVGKIDYLGSMSR